MSRAIRYLPLVLLGILLAALVWRLSTPTNTDVPSRLQGKLVPEFSLPAALPTKPPLASGDLLGGKPRIVNIFASWCVPCISEVRVLAELQRQGVEIDGIAVRDRPEDIAAFLKENGDPYSRIGADEQSRLQISLGSSGVPESFIVDGRGIVRYQHIGPIEPSDVPMILSNLEQAR